jgi:Major tropism determinant N-terminal domain
MSLQIRRGTDSQRQAVVFDLGEIVYTTDTKKLYVGDGATAGGINILASSAGSGLTWNNTTQTFNQGGSLSGYTTDNLPQGTVNLYYSSTRAKADAASIFTANGSPTVTGTVTTTTSGTPSLVTVSSNTGLVALEPFVVTGLGGNGLSAGTYYVVNPAAGTNQITLASSLANAAAGTTINSLTTGAISGTSFTAGGAPDSNITFVYNSATGTMTANVSQLAAGIQNVNADTSPSLGGNLGLNYHNITGNGNINITGYITASGAITGGSVSTAGTLTAGSVSTGGNVTASGTISGGTIASSGTISASGNITASGTITGTSYNGGTINGTTLTLSSGLGGNLDIGNYNITSAGTGYINIVGGITTSGNISTSYGSIATHGITLGNSTLVVNPANAGSNSLKLDHTALRITCDTSDQDNGISFVGTTLGLQTSVGMVWQISRGTVASPSIVQNGDLLNSQFLEIHNGTGFVASGAMLSQVDSESFTTGSNSIPTLWSLVTSNGYNTFNDTFSSVVRLTYNSSGILTAPQIKSSGLLTVNSYKGNLDTSTTYTSLSGTSVVAAATYTNVIPASTTGSGFGAVFTITKTGSGTTYNGVTTITVIQGGNGYAIGDTITIPGTSLGGTSPGNDLVFTLATYVVNGVGYSTGSGGTVTQLTSKATGVTLNKPTGTIVLNNASLASGAVVSFTFTNGNLNSNDMVVINHSSGGTLGAYSFAVTPALGSCTVYVRNNTAGALAEALTLQFAVIKSAVA